MWRILLMTGPRPVNYYFSPFIAIVTKAKLDLAGAERKAQKDSEDLSKRAIVEKDAIWAGLKPIVMKKRNAFEQQVRNRYADHNREIIHLL